MSDIMGLITCSENITPYKEEMHDWMDVENSFPVTFSQDNDEMIGYIMEKEKTEEEEGEDEHSMQESGLKGRGRRTADFPKYQPFLRLDENNGNTSMSGSLAEALDILAQRLNFTYTLYRVPEDAWGVKGPNGWTGMLGMLGRNEVDLALGPFSLSYSRWSSFPMSMPMYVDNVQILAPSFQWELELFSMVKIFHSNVWISIFLSAFAISLVTTIVDKYYDRSCSFKYRFFKNLWKASTFLLQKGRSLRPKGCPYVILGGFWMMGTVVLAYIFNAMVLTNLFLRKVRQIDSIHDLAAARDIQPILLHESSIFGVFREGKVEVYQSLFEKIGRNPDSIMKYDDMSTIGMERVLKGSFALVTDEMDLKSFLAKRYREGLPCNYHLAKDPAWTLWSSIAFKSSFPKKWIRKINRLLLRTMESNWLQRRMEKEYIGYTECLTPGISEVESLGLAHTKDAFLFWSIGCVLAIIALLLELSIKPH